MKLRTLALGSASARRVHLLDPLQIRRIGLPDRVSEPTGFRLLAPRAAAVALGSRLAGGHRPGEARPGHEWAQRFRPKSSPHQSTPWTRRSGRRSDAARSVFLSLGQVEELPQERTRLGVGAENSVRCLSRELGRVHLRVLI